MIETCLLIKKGLLRACCLLTVYAFVNNLNAQQTVFSWSGLGSSDLWSDRANWIGGNIPSGGVTNDLVFGNASVRSSAFQDLGSQFKIGSMYVPDHSQTFTFSGGQIEIDGTNGGSLEIEGIALIYNDLLFSNNSGIVINGGIIDCGGSITQSNQTTGSIRVTGEGDLNLRMSELPAHLQVDKNIHTSFHNIMNVSNGFDTDGVVNFFGIVNFEAGGTINERAFVNVATIQTSSTTSLEINDTFFVGGDGHSLRIEDDSTLDGVGRLVLLTYAEITLGANATIGKDVEIYNAYMFGESGTSTITGDVEISGSALLDGQLHLTGTLNASGNPQSRVYIRQGAAIEVDGVTTVETCIMQVGPSAVLFGAGNVVLVSGGVLDLRSSTIANDISASNSGVFGGAGTSTIMGAVEMSDLAYLSGQLNLTNTLTVAGGQRTFISVGANVDVEGVTTVESGVLEVSSSSSLFGNGNVIVESNGTLDLWLGSVAKDIMLDDGARLTGTGDIIGTLIANGVIDPGAPTGMLAVEGNVVLAPTTETRIDLGGDENGQFDVIKGITGIGDGSNSANLDGNLVVSLVNDFVPSNEDEFLIIQNLAIEGSFANTKGSGGNGSLNIGSGVFQVEYGSNYVRLFGFKATHDSLLVTRGTHISGGLGELAVSDDADLSIQRATSDIQSRTEFEVTSTSPTASPTSLSVTLEGAVFARSTIIQSIELYDYAANAWELVDSRNASNLVDLIVTVAATGDLNRFVEQTNLNVKARIRFQSLNPRQRFASNTDQFIWTIGQ